MVGGCRARALAADAPEYNRDTDPAAAAFVLAHAGLEVWQFPVEAYRRCAVSVAELEADLPHTGRVGAWLWQRFVDLPLPDGLTVEEVWPLGDSVPLLVTALADVPTPYHVPREKRRVYGDIDGRLLVADLFAKLRLHERRAISLDR
jgi:hypothetical protein